MSMIWRVVLLTGAMVTGPVLGQTGFEVVIDEQVQSGVYTGRVYVALVPAGSGREPRAAMHAWFSPPPVFSVDVSGVAPGEVIALAPGGMAHPVDMDSIEPGEYDIQAVIHGRRTLERARVDAWRALPQAEVTVLRIHE